MENPNYKEKILMSLTLIPEATVQQLAKLAEGVTQPQKKIAYYLKQLETQGLTQARYFQRNLLWSLTPKEKKRRRVTIQRTKNTLHDLAITTICLDLITRTDKAGKALLTRFDFEPRYKYIPLVKEVQYAPDAVITYNGKTCIIESQITTYSESRWAGKWKNANMFFTNPEWKKHFDEIPYFIAVTNSSKEVTCSGFNVPNKKLNVCREISEIFPKTR